MAYVDWDDFVDVLKGEKRLKELLLPHVETAEAHPFLDKAILYATQFANGKLKLAGVETPLAEPLSDEVLKSAIIGVAIDEITRGDGSRAAQHDKLAAAAYKYFKDLIEGKAEVVGGEPESDASNYPQIVATDPDDPKFDFENPYSEGSSVFGSLPPPGFRRW